MPIYLRKFYLKKLIEVNNKEQEEIEKSSKQNKPTQQPRYKK